MITGYNANVRHRGRVFHVQTEDSGRTHPHVITHLYYEGTILASERRDYAEMVGAPDLVARVRRLMEEQHASMVERLRGGDFDPVIAARLGAPGGAAAPAEMATPAEPEPALPLARRPAATAPPRAAAPAAAAAATAPLASAAAPPGRARAFGEGIVSERPLDDVILDYLVAQSRERAGGGRGSRSEG